MNFSDLWIVNELKRALVDDNRYMMYVNGFINTLKITGGALVVGLIIGIIIAAIRTSYDKNRETMQLKGGIGYGVLSVVNWICKVYLTVIRGTPVVVQLMIMYFVVFASSSNGVLVGIVAFGINSAAYVAEIFRAGIMSVDQGQFEAGRSIGFNYFQTMRYIIIPQMFKAVLPHCSMNLSRS